MQKLAQNSAPGRERVGSARSRPFSGHLVCAPERKAGSHPVALAPHEYVWAGIVSACCSCMEPVTGLLEILG